jgi:drug/metabolite transporter (DMT)-like permease
VTIPWFVAALGAAVVWGVHYPLVDYALKRLSVTTVLVLTALPIALLVPFFWKSLAHDAAQLRAMPLKELVPILALTVTTVTGALLLFLAIGGKNATLASLIEITYPVFVALFAFVLFREVHLTASVLVGAGLVFAGVFLIIWHNP